MCPIFSGCADTVARARLNVTHKKSYKSYEGKTSDVTIVFIGYVNDHNKFQQFKVNIKKSELRLQCTFQPSWQ
jgi:hypothetical protein